MKWYQAVRIAEEVKILRERATVLRFTYILLKPCLNYFVPPSPKIFHQQQRHASHHVRDQGEISVSHSGVVEGSVPLRC